MQCRDNKGNTPSWIFDGPGECSTMVRAGFSLLARTLGKGRTVSPKRGPKLSKKYPADIGLGVECGRHRARLDRARANFHRLRAKFARLRADSGASLADAGTEIVEFEPVLAEFGRIRAGFARLGRSWSMPGQCQSVRVRANDSVEFGKALQLLIEVGRFRATLRGRVRACVLADSGLDSGSRRSK